MWYYAPIHVGQGDLAFFSVCEVYELDEGRAHTGPVSIAGDTLEELVSELRKVADELETATLTVKEPTEPTNVCRTCGQVWEFEGFDG